MKKIILSFLILTMCFSMTYANTNYISEVENSNRSAIALTGIDFNLNIEDSIIKIDKKKIETIIDDLFLEKENCFLTNKQIKLSNTKSKSFQSLENSDFIKLAQFENTLRASLKEKISNEKMSYEVCSIDVKGDSAIANCVEYYEYLYQGQSIKSCREIEYKLYFIKSNGYWILQDVASNNELECLTKEGYESIADTEKINADQEYQDIEEQEKLQNNNLYRGNLHAYSRSDAAEYALQYSSSSSNTSSYNMKFNNYSPNDCQNFASQCVWSGLGGNNTTYAIDNQHKPMINKSGREWYGRVNASYSWINVGAFRDYVVSESEGLDGIYGIRYAKGNVKKAQKGDVIQIHDSNGIWYHSYIINSVTGTYGQRTINNIFVCAHTANRRNENLAAILGANATNLRLVRINGIRY